MTHLAIVISGISLPFELGEAAVIEHEDSFVIIGGNPLSDKIYRYNATSGVWTELQTTLSEKKHSMTLMKVKSTEFDSCNTIG